MGESDQTLTLVQACGNEKYFSSLDDHVLSLEYGKFVVEKKSWDQASHLAIKASDNSGLHVLYTSVANLWFSCLAELQLKPKHQPYKVCRQWHELLLRFTRCSEDEIFEGADVRQVPISVADTRFLKECGVAIRDHSSVVKLE